MNRVSDHSDKPRICFVAHDAYGAMTGGSSGRIGGVERQTLLMATWFAARGYQVSVLTWDEGGPAEEVIGAVHVIKLCRQNAGIKGLRFLWPKWTSLIAGVKRADADIYYHNLAECVTGQVALWCRRRGRQFVFSVSADTQCKARLPYRLGERILYRCGLRCADEVIVQTQRQQRMIQENFGCDSTVLPMPCPGPNEDEYRECELNRSDSQHVLWVGKIYKVKRPDRLLDLAQACPDLHFDIVGPAYDSEYATGVCQRAKTLTNVTLHGPVSRACISTFYRKATLMCCTSDSEGFPNTFLEAWSYGLPIVSTFDPDDLIANSGLGIATQDLPGLAHGLRSLCQSPEQRRGMSQRARQFYLKNHMIDAVMPRYESMFLDIYRNSRGNGPTKHWS